MKVFISPVGSTDPVRDDFDGPMLHIARHYKPEKIYLILTNEMARKDELENPYVSHLENLYKSLNLPSPIIEKKFFYTDDASDFEVFLGYTEINNQIEYENPECEIIANISSGTPQMIVCLCLDVISNNRNFKLIQVLTPKGKSNDSAAHQNAKPSENLDHMEDPKIKNRCREPKLSAIKIALIRTKLLTLVNSYRYGEGIGLLSDSLGNIRKDKLGTMLLIGDSYIRADFSDLQKYANSINYPLPKVYSGDVASVVQALKLLEIKQKNSELTDFSTRLTPLIFQVGLQTLKNLTGVLPNGIYQDKECAYRIDPVKICEAFEKEIPNNHPYLSFENIINICEHNNCDKDTLDLMVKLRDIEKSIRNKAAHSLTKILESDFEKKGYTTNQLLKDVKKFAKGAFKSHIKDEDLNYLETLNEAITKQLPEVKGFRIG